MLEIIAMSVDDAVAAQAGGADRIELVARLDQDGLTPPFALVAEVRAAVRIPVRVMLRERNTFDADPNELDALCDTAARLQALDIGGLVLGFTRKGLIDTAAVRRICDAAPALPVTFHRAIEHVNDPQAALGMLRGYAQIDTLLYSGGHGDWPIRLQRLRALVRLANGRFRVLAGGGMTIVTINDLRASGVAADVHVGRAARVDGAIDAPIDSARVREIKRLLTPRVYTDD